MSTRHCYYTCEGGRVKVMVGRESKGRVKVEGCDGEVRKVME